MEKKKRNPPFLYEFSFLRTTLKATYKLIKLQYFQNKFRRHSTSKKKISLFEEPQEKNGCFSQKLRFDNFEFTNVLNEFTKCWHNLLVLLRVDNYSYTSLFT